MSTSLASGVSGLKTHQTKMDVIGNNIANVNTYGFKSSRVTFKDVYYQTITGSSNANGNMGGANNAQVGYGTTVGTIDVMNSRGGFASTGSDKDCYINGEGYFVVKDGSGNERLTQVGTFDFDGSGNLVDGQTNFVCGYPLKDYSSKATIGGATINFGTANAKLMDGYTVEVKYATAAAGAATTAVVADSTKKTITVTFTPSTDNPTATAPLTKLTRGALQTALTTTWATPLPTTAPDFDISKITVEGGATIDATVNSSVTAASGSIVAQGANFDTTNGAQKIVNSYGLLTGLTFGADGTISGQDSTGTIQVIGQLALADVPNPQALTLEGNSYYKAINNTGTVMYSAPGSGTVGALKTGGLETSNVDLATEFSDMITTQRGFQANSKIITVSDDMLDTLINMKR